MPQTATLFGKGLCHESFPMIFAKFSITFFYIKPSGMTYSNKATGLLK